jgi:hypothetical protein
VSAGFTNNVKLAQKVKFSKGKLRHERYNGKKQWTIFSDFTKLLVGSLSPCGITHESCYTTAEPELVKKTAERGGFKVKSLASGTYQVTLKKVGYTDQVVTVNVNDGEMTELNVSL